MVACVCVQVMKQECLCSVVVHLNFLIANCVIILTLTFDLFDSGSCCRNTATLKIQMLRLNIIGWTISAQSNTSCSAVQSEQVIST